MKRTALFVCLASMVMACQELSQDNGKITIEEAALTQQFVTEGGVAEVKFTATSDWNVQQYNTNHYTWASITPTSGGPGENTVYVTVLKNETNDHRDFSFLIKTGADSKEVKVFQKQKDALTVTDNKFEFDAFGGQFEIEVIANIDYEYEISENATDWITPVATKGLESTKVIFNVAMNKNITDDRQATVKIKSGNFEEVITVDQTKFVPEWSYSATEAWIGKDGGNCEFTFEANQEFEVIAPAVDWVTMTESNGTYHFEMKASTEYDTRVAYVNLIGDVPGADSYVVIYQTGHAELLWEKSILNTPAAHTNNMVNLSILNDEYLVLGNSSVITLMSPEDGSIITTIDGVSYHSLCTDDAGHVILGTFGDYGASEIYYATINGTDVQVNHLASYDGGIWSRLSNYRAAGDVTKNGIVTALASVSQYWAAWEITDGAVAPYKCGQIAPNAGIGTIWYPGYGVVIPMGPKLSDGLAYCAYDGVYALQVCTDPASNTWKQVYKTFSTWAEGGSGVDVAEFNGRKYAAIQSTTFTEGADVGCYLVDITDLDNAKLVHQLNIWEISAIEAYTAYDGGGDCRLLVKDDAMYLYAVDGNYNIVTCVKFPKL
ncbi:MAG: BACON domain-containing protein [Bacteroidales bacterium]|nr:BACON domain-containing protein [Bacteroidales bacterium]